MKGFVNITLSEKYEKVIYTDTAVRTFIVEQINAIDKFQKDSCSLLLKYSVDCIKKISVSNPNVLKYTQIMSIVKSEYLPLDKPRAANILTLLVWR